MTLLDLILGAMVIGSVVAGFISGFTKAAFGLIATFAGTILGFWFYDIPAKWYSKWFESEIVTYLLGFLTVFLGVILVGTLLGRLFSTMFKVVGMGFLDRLAGAGFGLVRGALAAAATVVILLAATPRPIPAWIRGSVTLPYALKVSDIAASLAPAEIKAAITASIREIEDLWKGSKPLPEAIDQ